MSCKLLDKPHVELLQYKKVVMHLVTNFLKLVNLDQQLNYAVDPLARTLLVHK